MGNKSSKENAKQKQLLQSEALQSSSLAANIETNQPFTQGLPQLFGPDDKGFYYHQHDLQKAQQGQFKFKYNAIDYEHKQSQLDDDDDNKDYKEDEKNDDKNNMIDSKYNKCRYSWVWITNDNIEFHKIKEYEYYNAKYQKMERLPEEYEKIRKYLVDKDPIPPYFLRSAKMAGMVFQDCFGSRLCKIKDLKCKIAVKILDHAVGINIEHPALLMWDKQQEFLQYVDDTVMLLHLTKLPEEYKDTKEMESGKDRIEIQCKPINKYGLDKYGWKYIEYKEQDLNLENGLLDIAHWCLKYEMKQNYQYSKYIKNCRRFISHLCKQFNIEHDASKWTDGVFSVVEKTQSTITEYKWC